MDNKQNMNKKQRMPYKRTRMNLQTGITEEHIFTEEELQQWRDTGVIKLKEDAVWTPVTPNQQ